MNYLRSEFYRLIKTKMIYMILLIWLSLFVFLTFGITSNSDIVKQAYSEVILSVTLMEAFFFVSFINHAIVGKNLATLKQSLSFGITRSVVYFTKIILTILVVAFFLTIIGFACWGIEISTTTEVMVPKINWLAKIISTLPLLISCIVLSNCLNFAKINPVLSTLIVFTLYFTSGDILQIVDHLIFKRDFLCNYTPPALLLQILASHHILLTAVCVGVGMTMVFLFWGMRLFKRMDVA